MSVSDNYTAVSVLNSAADPILVTMPAWYTADNLTINDVEVTQQDLADGTLKSYLVDGGFTIAEDTPGQIDVEKFSSFTGNVDVIVTRITAQDQTYSPVEGAALDPTALEAALDKTVKRLQEIDGDGVGNAITSPNPHVIPDKVSRADKIITYDSNGDLVLSDANSELNAKEWAIRAEDDAVPVANGGDGSTTFSSLHHAAKSSASASAAAASAALIPQHKNDATVDPTSTDDSGSGYAVNSRWTNVTDDTHFICVDATVSGAIWKQVVTSIFEHIASADDEHAIELCVDANGYGDVKALDIVYDTDALPTTDDEAVVLVNIDDSDALGGEVAALEVIATEGLSDIDALVVGANVGLAKQFSGTFTDMDSALVLAVDRLTEFTTAGSDIQMFIADNDTVTIGNAAKFSEIEFLLAVVASQNIQPTFEYSTGVGTWATFVPTDGTNGMRNNGAVLWNPDDIPSWALGTGSEYLIRITRTRNNLNTPPTESKVQIVEATQFYWDKSGNVKVNDLEVVGTLTGVGGIAPTQQEFTSSGTYTTPTNPAPVAVRVRVQAGGAGSGATRASSFSAGGGGGGGEYAEKWILAASLGVTETVTVGAGGTAGAAASGDGGTGGTSSFGAHVSVIGGSGTGTGDSGATDGDGGAGGSGGTGGDLHIDGGDGEDGHSEYDKESGSGGNSILGFGGKNQFNGNAAGTSGTGYGSGGGGAVGNNNAGAAGQPGIVIVEEYY